MKLTEMAIRQAKGIGKVQKLYDGGGLYLYITADGKKSWRMTGKPVGQVLMESLVPEVKTKITRNGVLVFTLPDGGKICDSGRQITFSDIAKEKATEYMAAKWMVKKQEWGLNRGSLMLPDGQYLEDTGKNMFVRPAIVAKERRRSMER